MTNRAAHMYRMLKLAGHVIVSLPELARGEIKMRRLQFADPSLSQAVRAMRTRAAGEQEWSARIEKVRHALEQSHARVRLPLTDEDIAYSRELIGRSHDREPPRIEDGHLSYRVGEMTRAASKNDAWGKIFYRIVRALRPKRCLELGTSVGISASYIGAALEANRQGRLITIERHPAVVEVAERTLSTVGLGQRVEVRVGMFADEIPTAMADLGGVDLAFIDGHHERQPTIDYFEQIVEHTAPGGLLIFDDVKYPINTDMELAWEDIRSSSRVTAALTIGSVGLAVIDGRQDAHTQLRRLRL